MSETPALERPIEERIAYATVVASMAAADDVIAASEIRKLRELCKGLGLPEAQADAIVAIAQNRNPEAVQSALARLRASDLRFTLFTDCLLLAYADDRVLPSEERALAEVAHELDISDSQAAAMRELVEASRRGAASAEEASSTAAKLAAAGVPVGAVALASAAGLSSAGVATGLGALAAGLGVATGVGAVIGIGIGTVIGVRWLHHRLLSGRPDEAKQFEYMKQGCTLTLAEGFEQFHASIPGLIGEKPMSSEHAAEMFRLHDHCHVVFGCDTSVDNEGLVDTWSVFGTDVTVKEYLDYTKIPEAKEIFEEAGFMRSLLEAIKVSPKLFEVFLRTRDMTKKWPFHTGPETYGDWRLVDIRDEFNIHLM